MVPRWAYLSLASPEASPSVPRGVLAMVRLPAIAESSESHPELRALLVEFGAQGVRFRERSLGSASAFLEHGSGNLVSDLAQALEPVLLRQQQLAAHTRTAL
ncbi:MAG: hypothetical protein H7Z16_05715 [Pyrinomonadaceae bacterium]|nr:hypothetical protein [Pyrinomonadaceae bacterium]